MNRGTIILSLLLIMAFALLVFQEKWLALLSLCLALGLLFHSLWRLPYPELAALFGFQAWNRGQWKWIGLAAAICIPLAAVYRNYVGHSWAPEGFGIFLPVAISIGITEELVFRGYFFGAFRNRSVWAILFSAAGHTAYKTGIFLPFPAMTIWDLGLLTFLAGLLLGWMRSASGSIWSCLSFHALFDLWVYGDQHTPWWVW